MSFDLDYSVQDPKVTMRFKESCERNVGLKNGKSNIVYRWTVSEKKEGFFLGECILSFESKYCLSQKNKPSPPIVFKTGSKPIVLKVFIVSTLDRMS